MAVTFMAFGLLEVDGKSLLGSPLSARRALLESLDLNSSYWMTPDTFADGPALYAAVCKHGLEGIVAKRGASTYRPGQRGRTGRFAGVTGNLPSRIAHDLVSGFEHVVLSGRTSAPGA